MRLLKRNTTLIAAIFFIAFIVRLIYLIEIRSNPFFDNPITDGLWHDQWAQQIAAGNNYLSGIAFFRAPLYPYFLGFIHYLVGHNYFIPRLVQIILGSLSCILIFLIGGKCFDRKIGFIAAMIASVYGPFIYFDCELLITSVFTLLTLATVFLLLHAIEKKKSYWWLVSGISLGLAAITRPTIMILVPGVFIWLFLYRKNVRWKTSSLSFLIGMIMMMAPITIRNYIAEKDFVLISSQGGINYFIGNNPLSDGKTAKAPSMDKPPMGVQDHIWYSSVKVAERAVGTKLKSSQVSIYWFKRGLNYLFSDPLEFGKLQLRKMYYYVNAFEVESNLSIYLHKRFSVLFRVLVWTFGIVFPLGLIMPFSILGMIWYRKRWRKTFLLYYFVVSYSLSVIAFFVTARFRIPVVPYLMMFAAYAIFHITKHLKNNNARWLVSSAIAFSAILAFTNSNLLGVREVNRQREHYLLGYAYARNGSYLEAMQELKKSLRYPDDPFILAQGHYIMGDVYCVQQRYGDAEKAYIDAIRINPNHAKVYLQLGNLYSILGYIERAEFAYRKALEIVPEFKEARVNLELLQKHLQKGGNK